MFIYKYIAWHAYFGLSSIYFYLALNRVEKIGLYFQQMDIRGHVLVTQARDTKSTGTETVYWYTHTSRG